MLWEKSNSIFPPHHINFMSVAGFEYLFVRAGLDEVEVTTPGLLDVDIICNAIKRDQDLLNGQRFLRRIVTDQILAVTFQAFLAANRLSSHAWVIGKKPIVEEFGNG
jgi:hypothetical protein